MMYPCCSHCPVDALPRDWHSVRCLLCEPDQSYVEATDANPERVNNGCMVFRVGQR